MWVGNDGNDDEIYLYNGTTTTNISNNTIIDYDPQISGNNIVWTGNDGNDSEIYLYQISQSLPTLRINNVTITEGNSGTKNAVFTVTRTGTPSGTITVNYSTSNGTATAGSDYVSKSGNLSFATNETSKTISVVINGDTTVEPNETFFVNLSNATNATIVDNQGQGTITNDDNITNLLLVGDANNNNLVGGAGNDTLRGLGGNDTLRGGAGNDILDGGTGADSMVGGTGNDTYYVDNTGDRVIETKNNGTDTVKANINYGLPNHVENLILTGKANLKGTGNKLNNTIKGNKGNNSLKGQAGNDTLIGNSGKDILTGAGGDDILTGGAGKDIFVFNSKKEGIDTITDFKSDVDIIQIKASGFGGGLQAGILADHKFVLGTKAKDANDRFIYNQSNGKLFFDADGVGDIAKIQIASLSGLPELDARDLAII